MGKLKSVFRGIGRAIGRRVEKVGDYFGSEKISRVGRNIQEALAEEPIHRFS